MSKFRKAGVGDVRIENEKPRHLNSGKRSFKADYRWLLLYFFNVCFVLKIIHILIITRINLFLKSAN